MQITLNQNEIEKAILAYVSNQGIAITGKKAEVTMTAGRGEKGMSATIDIIDFDEDCPTTAPTKTASNEPDDTPDTAPEEGEGEQSLFGQ